MRHPENLNYHFGNVEVYPSRGCLLRDGQELYLRRKTFDVLLYLLARHNQLVTKQELLETVWKGTAVTDDVLVQCVVDIRKAIGDDSRRPRFVRTVPKLGYRFIGSVGATPSMERAVVAERVTSADAPGGEAQDVADSSAALLEPEKVPPAPPARRFAGKFLAAVALAFVLLAGTGLLSSYRARSLPRNRFAPGVPELAGKKPVEVMSFENQSGDPGLDWMRDGLADLFVTDLSRSPKLSVLSRQQLHVLLDQAGHPPSSAIRLQEALEVAQKSGAEVFLMGSYTKFGDKLRIGVQLYDARDGRLLKDESLVVDRPEEILAQVNLLSLKLAAIWGGPGQSNRAGLGAGMTNNLEAYRYYSLGLEKALALHSADAIALFQKAAELDPQFAMAYARIGYSYVIAWGQPEKGKPYLEKAFQLSPRLTEKDRLSIAAWYALANRDYAGAIREFREFISRYPLEVEAYWRLAALLTGEDQRDEAIAVLQQALVVAPEQPETYNRLGWLYSAAGRHNEAIGVYRHDVALAPREANAHDSLGLGYQWAGLYREAAEEYDKALALDPKFEIALIHLANLRFQMGHYRDAILLSQRYIDIAPSPMERSRGYSNLAWIYWRQGNLPEAAKAAKEAGRLSQGMVLASVMIAVERGDLKSAEAMVQQFRDSLFTDRGSRQLARHSLYPRGYVEFKAGHADKAIAVFQETLRHVPATWDIDSHESCLADLYLQLRRYDEAIAEYDRILRLNPNYPLVHYQLGLAYEGKGQGNQARSEFRRFLEAWQNADPNIPEVVFARQRLSASAKSGLNLQPTS